MVTQREWFEKCKKLEKLSEKKIKEIMTKDVVTAQEDDDLMEVIKLFGKYKYNGIPILDKNKNLVGIVTRSDLLRFVTFERSPLSIGISSFIGVPTVKLFMCSRPMTVSPEDSVKDVASIMLRHGVRTLPVVAGKKLVGIVSKYDIVEAIHRELTS